MNNIVIIGSDSYIATIFYNYYKSTYKIRLYTIKSSNKPNEIITDLFSINHNSLKNCSVIINFAAIVHKPELKDNMLYHKINTDLPVHLAIEAKKAGIKHFIQMSTIAVYGQTEFINENSFENPENIYAKTKLAADKKLLELQNEKFKVSIIRPPMVYGGGKAPGNLLKLINFAQKGFPMPFKNINNKRDFIHVRNLVNAIDIVITHSLYGIIIPTDNNPVSTEKLINIIKQYSKNKIRLIKLPGVIIKIIKLLIPTTYNKVFGSLLVSCNIPNSIYCPKVTIETGIKEMIELE